MPFHWNKLKERAPKLLFSGLLLGLDWVFFFEAFNHTTVAIATLCYYMAPVFMLAAAPLVFHETIRRRKLVCAAITIGGMLLVSGVLGSDGNIGDITGVLCALAGAFFYAAIIVLSKTIQGLDPYEQTAVQLGTAAFFLLVYCLFTGQMDFQAMTGTGWGLTLLLGVVHTGLAYGIYFGSLTRCRPRPPPSSAMWIRWWRCAFPYSYSRNHYGAPAGRHLLVLGGMISGERK